MDIYCEKSISQLPDLYRLALSKANVFYSSEYSMYLFAKGFSILYLYSMTQIIIVAHKKRFIFSFAYFPSEPVYIGDNVCRDNESDFLSSCVDFLKRRGIQWLSATPASTLFTSYPKNSIRIPFGNYVIDLSQAEADLFAKFHSKTRNAVRRAESAGVYIKYGNLELINDYMIIDNDTTSRNLQQKHDQNLFQEILSILGKYAIVFIVYKDSIPQGGAIFYYNNAMCYYMYGASKKAPETGSINYLHWEAIKYMKAQGTKKYSFVGCRINVDENSKYHDIQRFKKNFGGDLVEGYLFKSILKPFYYSIYSFLMNIKNRGKQHPDIIDQELWKWPLLQSSMDSR